jgi:hypothetical protein
MMKRKRSKREIGEQARVEAENRPPVRALRELHARGMAEPAARLEKDPALARASLAMPAFRITGSARDPSALTDRATRVRHPGP